MNLRRVACKGPPLPSPLLHRRRGSGLLGHALSAKKIVHAINWYLFAPLSIAAGTAPAAGAAHSQATISNEDRVSYLDNGVIRLGDEPGHGIRVNTDAVQTFLKAGAPPKLSSVGVR